MEVERLYSKFSNLIFGFHGCDKSVADDILIRGKELKTSNNSYDWLGNGIYFWENSHARALDWAKNNPKIKEAAVIGAIIDLGHCLNLADYGSASVLNRGYKILLEKNMLTNALREEKGEKPLPLPQNRKSKDREDIIFRDLDCAVIQQIHKYRKENNLESYDSVRGIFQEGAEAFEGSCFREKNHIQICVINPNCVKGYFNPKHPNIKFSIP